MTLDELIDNGNRLDVAECNRLLRSLETLRRLHAGSSYYGDIYDALMDARCCCAIRLDYLRDRIAEMSAPWFEVQQSAEIEQEYDYEADDRNFDAAREDAAFGRSRGRD